MKNFIERKHEILLLNHFNTFFTGKIGISEPGNKFRVIFDTGSTLTFIISTKCIIINFLINN